MPPVMPCSKFVVLGVLNAVAAAMASIAVLALVQAESLVDAIVGPVFLSLYGVFVFSSYIVPLGAVLGVLLPNAVAGRSYRTAVMIGMTCGALVAGVSALLYQTVTVYLPVARSNVYVSDWPAFWAEFWLTTARAAAAFVPVCVIWSTVAAAHLWRQLKAN